VRWIGWCVVLLIIVGWLASELRFPETPTASAKLSEKLPDCWRRTPDGWQRAEWLIPQIPVRRPALHPGVIGLMVLLVSILGLVAFPAETRPRRLLTAPRNRVESEFKWHRFAI